MLAKTFLPVLFMEHLLKSLHHAKYSLLYHLVFVTKYRKRCINEDIFQTIKVAAAHLSRYYWKPYFWSRGYYIISSGGAPVEVIKRYIRSQKRDKE